MRTMHGMHQLELFPDTAAVESGRLVLGGIRATDLAREFGTPVVVYDEQTLRNQARAYLAAAPGALVAYGTKAFPSIAVLQLFVEEGLGADVSTVGELEFALRAGHARRAARHPRQQQGGRAAARGRSRRAR